MLNECFNLWLSDHFYITNCISMFLSISFFYTIFSLSIIIVFCVQNKLLKLVIKFKIFSTLAAISAVIICYAIIIIFS